MNWTFTNLIIEIIAGIVGGHIAALAAREHSFGALGHTITGAIGGTVSGVFLQTLVATVVDSTGQVNQDADLLTLGCCKFSRGSRPAPSSPWRWAW